MIAMTCFDILHIPPNASLDEAKESYKRLVKLWHPDQYGNFPEKQMIAQEKLKEINVAYRDIVALLKRIPVGTETPTGEKERHRQPEENSPANNKKGAPFWSQVALFINTNILKSNRSEDPDENAPHPPGGTQREGAAFVRREDAPPPDFQQILKRAIIDRRLSGAARQRRVDGKRVRRQFGSTPSYRAGTTTKRSPGERVEKITPVGRVNRIGGD
jgi:hypothetical protein